MVPVWLALVLAAQAAATGAAAPPGDAAPAKPKVTVAATASKPEVGLGEVFAVEVKASGPAGTSYTFPGELGDDTVELRTPLTASASPAVAPGVLHRYEAAVFSLNQAQIPPIPVRYRLADGTTGEAATAPLDLKVDSVLPRDPQQQKPADIRGPLPVSIGRAFWVALGVAVVCLAALVAWLLRRRRPPAPVAATAAPAEPADVEALRSLDALAGSGLLAAGEYRAFYIQLAALAKRYLERRLEAPVLEMTTAETLAFLRGQPSADDLLPTVRDVASAADRIKFARGEGLVAEAERHLDAVRRLVTTLEERLRPRPPLADGQAA